MSHRGRRVLAALVAAVALAVAVGSSAATTFSMPRNTFSFTWPALAFEASGISVRCAVTLTGSIHSRGVFEAVARADIGDVTNATVGACSGGSATVLTATLPWTLEYGGSTGTPPNVTSVSFRLVGASLNIDPSEAVPACLARSTSTNPIVIVAARESLGSVTSATPDPDDVIPLSGGFFCSVAGTGRLTGSGSFTDTGDADAPSIGAVELFVDGVGTRLDDGGGAPIADLNIDDRGDQEERNVVNTDARWDLTILSVGMAAPNRERYELLEAALACETGFVLQVSGGNMCRNLVRRKEETADGVNSKVQIVSRQGDAILTQTFNVNAT